MAHSGLGLCPRERRPRRSVRLRRREFIAFLGVAATARALSAQAQVANRPARIGFVPLGSPSNGYDRSLVETFRRGLIRVGLVENRDVLLDIVWTTGGPEQAVTELLQRGVDILVTCGTSASLAAKRQTWVIPIVFISVGNPVGIGMAESTARPGQNATGFSDILSELGGKLVGLAAELTKHEGSVDYLWYTEWADGKDRLRKTRDEAEAGGVKFRSHGISDIGDMKDAVAKVKESGAVSLIIQPSPFTYRERDRLIDLSASYGLGTIFAFPIAAREGALMAYGPDYTHMYDRTPFYVDRILKGTKPADLPIEEASKLELVINLNTAKAIGLEVPLTLLIGADELIE
jgi:putative ABC transport system substrate-binding protein